MIRLVDTHCHLDFNRFDEDRTEVVRRAIEAGVVRIVVPGLDLSASRAICDLVEQLPGIYAAVGVHPNDLDHVGELGSTLDEIRKLARRPKVVAIGEIGIDYHWMNAPRPIQHLWLIRQLEMAKELKLPVILHSRESNPDLLELLRDWVSGGLPETLRSRPGVLHSFSGNWQEAEQVLELGFYIGLTGPLTYRNADEMRDVAAKAPADKLLIETDAPFLTPLPHRGKRNEPAYVRLVAEKLAEVRGIDLESVARMTTENAATLFEWDMAAPAS
jgi:TatD DNase family protein